MALKAVRKASEVLVHRFKMAEYADAPKDVDKVEKSFAWINVLFFNEHSWRDRSQAPVPNFSWKIQEHDSFTAPCIPCKGGYQVLKDGDWVIEENGSFKVVTLEELHHGFDMIEDYHE